MESGRVSATFLNYIMLVKVIMMRVFAGICMRERIVAVAMREPLATAARLEKLENAFLDFSKTLECVLAAEKRWSE